MNWAIVREPTILATSAVYGFLFWICVNAGILGLWLGILLSVSLWRYCYTVLRAVAQGRKRLPPPDIDSMNPVGQWAMFWHWICFPGLLIATAPFQPAGSVVAILVAIVFPASVAIMGLTGSLSQAFNPSALVHFMRTLGADYWSLVTGIVGMLVGVFLILRYIVPAFGFLAYILSLMVEVWALFSVFALIGSALRMHRLDFEIVGELKPREEEVLKHRHEDWRRDLDNAYASFRSGIAVSGYNTVRRLIAANGDSIEVNYWLVENMLEWRDKKYALEIAAKLIPRLLAGGDAAGALELYQRCRRRDPEFRPAAADAELLATHARTLGHAGLADELGYNRSPSEVTSTGSER